MLTLEIIEAAAQLVTEQAKIDKAEREKAEKEKEKAQKSKAKKRRISAPTYKAECLYENADGGGCTVEVLNDVIAKHWLNGAVSPCARLIPLFGTHSNLL